MVSPIDPNAVSSINGPSQVAASNVLPNLISKYNDEINTLLTVIQPNLVAPESAIPAFMGLFTNALTISKELQNNSLQLETIPGFQKELTDLVQRFNVAIHQCLAAQDKSTGAIDFNKLPLSQQLVDETSFVKTHEALYNQLQVVADLLS
jgi:hypothetical protein